MAPEGGVVAEVLAVLLGVDGLVDGVDSLQDLALDGLVDAQSLRFRLHTVLLEVGGSRGFLEGGPSGHHVTVEVEQIASGLVVTPVDSSGKNRSTLYSLTFHFTQMDCGYW